jgi:hypothetical protein
VNGCREARQNKVNESPVRLRETKKCFAQSPAISSLIAPSKIAQFNFLLRLERYAAAR